MAGDEQVPDAESRSGPEIEVFIDSCDRLVRDLFGIDLRLRRARGRSPDTGEEEWPGLIDDLAVLVRDSSTAMSAISRTFSDSRTGR
ncbi:hypothetical protein [Nocardia terpenica]|uniref:Uncharacterized protein n=1 Tax=Nocardia terpenica TaxID=455432 RepID=A0A164LMD5_9NOCA|nr:hypothetical protein [Nocardia terpenica]KZM72566.1 hypothetical protein AWN90_27595 [Nocardia terpenica]NQE92552.1 hypothetical protein [Nocardia terpenica]